MRLVFRPEALQELRAAKRWYEARAVGLGAAFVRAMDAAAQQALQMPAAHPRVHGEFRHVITRKFPYSLIYRHTPTEVVVVACFHHSRKPGAWLKE